MFSIFIASMTASFSPASTFCPGATATSTSSPGIGDKRNFDRPGGAFTGLELMPRHLPADARGALQVHPVGDGRERTQKGRIVMRHRRGRKPLRELLGDEAGVEVAGDELRMREQRRLERDVRMDAADR